jgi:hypothetical protein
MKAFALVAVALLLGCVESDHDRIANLIVASHESVHDLLFSGTTDHQATCGGEMLSGQGTDGVVLSLPPCTAHGEELETRSLELELVLPPPVGESADDNTIGAYDLVYLSGDEVFRGTHLMFRDYAFFTISVDGQDGTDRHATLDGDVLVDGAEVNFSKESYVLP